LILVFISGPSIILTRSKILTPNLSPEIAGEGRACPVLDMGVMEMKLKELL